MEEINIREVYCGALVVQGGNQRPDIFAHPCTSYYCSDDVIRGRVTQDPLLIGSDVGVITSLLTICA